MSDWKLEIAVGRKTKFHYIYDIYPIIKPLLIFKISMQIA